jgi:hypothetical protein
VPLWRFRGDQERARAAEALHEGLPARDVLGPAVKRRGDEWRDRGYSKAEAKAKTEAEAWAHRAASRFVGDWNVIVTKGRPPRR